jgi:hypothetical protein
MHDVGHFINGVELMERISDSLKPRKWMFDAIRQLRNAGFKTAAVTNNWIEDDNGNIGNVLRYLVRIYFG